MRRLLGRAAIAACGGLLALAAQPRAASAVELIKDLECVVISETHTGGQHCLKIVNTCNTPIVSRIEEKSGAQKDSVQVPRNERTKLCTAEPFTFLGSYIAGPLATGAGD